MQHKSSKVCCDGERLRLHNWQTAICLRFLTVRMLSEIIFATHTIHLYIHERWCWWVIWWRIEDENVDAKCRRSYAFDVSFQYLAKVHAQQLGNQNVSVYKFEPSPFTAINRFWTYFCSQRDPYPFGNEHKFEHTLDLWIDLIWLNWRDLNEIFKLYFSLTRTSPSELIVVLNQLGWPHTSNCLQKKINKYKESSFWLNFDKIFAPLLIYLGYWALPAVSHIENSFRTIPYDQDSDVSADNLICHHRTDSFSLWVEFSSLHSHLEMIRPMCASRDHVQILNIFFGVKEWNEWRVWLIGWEC